MVKILKYIPLAGILLFAVLIQQSFLAVLSPQYFLFNLCLVIVLSINFFEKYEKNVGITAAVFIGILLDILSASPFGVFTFTFILLGFFIKKAALFFRGAGVLSFTAIFLLSFFSFHILYFIFSFLLTAIFSGEIIFKQFSFNGFFFSLVANLIMALFFGFLFKILLFLKHKVIYS